MINFLQSFLYLVQPTPLLDITTYLVMVKEVTTDRD